MYETWKFLRTMLNEVDGQDEESVENRSRGRRTERRRSEQHRDTDLDNTATEEEMIKMLRGLRLVGEEVSEPGSCSLSQGPEESTVTVDTPMGSSNLPDCVASSVASRSSAQTSVPDLINRRRSSFRLDSQWICGHQAASSPSRDQSYEVKHVARSNERQVRKSMERSMDMRSTDGQTDLQQRYKVRPRSDIDVTDHHHAHGHDDGYDALSDDDDDDNDDYAGHSPKRRWSYGSMRDLHWRRRKHKEQEDQMMLTMKREQGTDQIDGRIQKNVRGKYDEGRRDPQTWSQCGKDLTRIALRRSKATALPALRTVETAASLRPENCSGAWQDLLGRQQGRRHSIAMGESEAVSQSRKSVLSDLVVLATLAGAYYCVNKLKSALL